MKLQSALQEKNSKTISLNRLKILLKVAFARFNIEKVLKISCKQISSNPSEKTSLRNLEDKKRLIRRMSMKTLSRFRFIKELWTQKKKLKSWLSSSKL